MCWINWLVPFIWLESCTPTHSVQSWVFSWLPLRSETWGKRVLVLCTCHYWSTVVLLTDMIYIIKWTNVETFLILSSISNNVTITNLCNYVTGGLIKAVIHSSTFVAQQMSCSKAKSCNFHFHKNDVTWPLSANGLLLSIIGLSINYVWSSSRGKKGLKGGCFSMKYGKE